MSIQFNIMYPVFKNFKTKFLLYNSLRTYDIFIVKIDQPFISFNNNLFFWLSKNPSGWWDLICLPGRKWRSLSYPPPPNLKINLPQRRRRFLPQRHDYLIHSYSHRGAWLWGHFSFQNSIIPFNSLWWVISFERAVRE